MLRARFWRQMLVPGSSLSIFTQHNQKIGLVCFLPPSSHIGVAYKICYIKVEGTLEQEFTSSVKTLVTII